MPLRVAVVSLSVAWQGNLLGTDQIEGGRWRWARVVPEISITPNILRNAENAKFAGHAALRDLSEAFFPLETT